MPTPLEHDYIGFTQPPSPPPMEVRTSDKLSSSPLSSASSSSSSSSSTNLKETELRLGLPGSQSPERKPGSGPVAHEGGVKRGFSDAIDADSCGKSWALSVGSGPEGELGKGSLLFSPKSGASLKVNNGGSSSPAMKEAAPKAAQEKPSERSSPPASKAQVVGWPPIRSFRKNTMASNLSKNNEESEDKAGIGCLYVKVSMDGAPYLRKVDLKTCKNYSELSSALEKMFSCFTIGQCGSAKLPERNGLTERCLKDLLHGSEYVVTYEDRDGDWMLVGDVPWDMFTDTCRRLRIMKGSEAIGLAPRAMEKCRSRN